MRLDDTNLDIRLRRAAERLEKVGITAINAAATQAAAETPSYIRSRLRRPSPRMIAPDVARSELARPGSMLARVYIAPDRVGALRAAEFGSPARTVNRPVAPEAMDSRGKVLPQFAMTGSNLERLRSSTRYFVGRPRGAKFDFEGIFERRFLSYKTLTVFEEVPARPPRLHLRRHWRSILPKIAFEEAGRALSGPSGDL